MHGVPRTSLVRQAHLPPVFAQDVADAAHRLDQARRRRLPRSCVEGSRRTPRASSTRARCRSPRRCSKIVEREITLCGCERKSSSSAELDAGAARSAGRREATRRSVGSSSRSRVAQDVLRSRSSGGAAHAAARAARRRRTASTGSRRRPRRALDPIVDLVARRQHEDRDAAPGADRAAGREAVEVRHQHVEHDDVGRSWRPPRRTPSACTPSAASDTS